MDLMFLLFFIIFIIFLLVKYAYDRPPGFPPGPPRLPIWGSYWILLTLNYKFPHLALRYLGKIYKTNVLGFYLGGIPAVITLNYDTTHEMLTRPEFTNRQINFVTKLRAFGKDLGIFFTNGEFWKEQRRYSLRTMRDYGLGRRSVNLENFIQSQMEDLIEMIRIGPRNEFEKITCDKPQDILMPHVFFNINQSIFWHVLTGEPFPEVLRNDQQLLFQNILKFQRVGEPLGGALVYTPWIRYLLPNFSGYNGVVESHFGILNFFKEYFDKVNDNIDKDNPKEYLLAIKEDETFSIEQLLLILVDQIIPATIATSTVLAFTFIHLIRDPRIQVKIQEEINSVVGRNRLPTLNDRRKMIYTEATIKEGLRKDSLNPLGIARECNEDTMFQGYFIPKGTFMLPGNHAVNTDPELWGDPENFRPERFIDGTIGKLVNKDYAVLFGAGKRVCVGETFSRQNMFLVLSGLLQNFTFSMPEGEELPDLNYQNNIKGINVAPQDFRVIATPRL